MAGRYAMLGAGRIQSSTKVPIFTTGGTLARLRRPCNLAASDVTRDCEFYLDEEITSVPVVLRANRKLSRYARKVVPSSKFTWPEGFGASNLVKTPFCVHYKRRMITSVFPTMQKYTNSPMVQVPNGAPRS
jgi:hypothetical protein